VLLAAGGAAAYLLTRPDDGPQVAAAAPADAGAAQPLAVDAGVPTAVADAAVTRPIDAGGRRPPVDGGRTVRRDAGPARPGRDIQVQVVTRPEQATLYAGGAYAGTGDTYISRPAGTRLTLTCKLPGYDPGKVAVVFDEPDGVFICRMKRPTRCVEGIKNPFDDCPD
jgi:hypothetical protein